MSIRSAVVAAGVDEIDPNNRGDLLVSTNPSGGRRVWTLIRPRRVTGISSVSCPTARLCYAATDNGVLISTRPTGRRSDWRLRPLRDAQDITRLTCPDATLCVATNIGGNGSISDGEPGTQRVWPGAALGEYDGFNAASCPSRARCLAVGERGATSIGTLQTPPGGFQ